MKDTLIFTWVDKKYLHEIIKYYDKLNINYVESIVCACLDNNEVNLNDYCNESSLNNEFIDLNKSLTKNRSKYFASSKLSILIFRYVRLYSFINN